MADLATLGLRVENGQAISELRQFDRAIDSTGKKAESLGRGLKTLAGYFGTGLIARAALRNIIEAQDEMALLENAVRATGGAAGRTVAQLDDMSVALQRTSRFSDEAAKGGLSRLVAYTSIQGAIFDRAAQAAVDFATAYRTDVTQAAESVGKALEYPEKGMQALQRQGFRLTEEQERLVKSLVATGEKAKAQEVVLGVLEEGMRGAALASRNTLGGALDALTNEFSNLFEVSKDASSGIVGALNSLANALPGIATKFDTFFDKLRQGFTGLKVGYYRDAADIQRVLAFFNEVDGAVFSRLPGETGELGRKQIEIAKRQREEVRRLEAEIRGDLNSISDAARRARENDPLSERNELAGLISGSPSGIDTPGASDEYVKKAAAMQGELDKLRALNAAYRETEIELKKIEIIYDTRAANSALAQEFAGKELSGLQGLNNAMAEAKIRALDLAAAKEAQAEATERNIRAQEKDLELALKIIAGNAKDVASVASGRFDKTFSGGRSLEQATKDSVAESIGITINWTKKLNKNFGDLSSGAERAAQVISQAIEYMIVQKVGGGTASGNFGAAIAKGAFADFAGGFGATALGGAIFGPLVAGIGATVGSLFDFGSKAKRAAAELQAMTEAAQASALAAKVNAQGYETVEQRKARETANFRKQYDERREQLAKGGLKPHELEELATMMHTFQELIARLDREDAFARQSASEDLEVRALRAQGKDREAEIMERENRQAREVYEAERQNMGDAYIARLKEIHAIEDTATALDKLTTSVRNAPSGFKIESYINRFAEPRPWNQPPTTNIPYSPERPTGGIPKATTTTNTYTVTVKVDGAKNPRDTAVEVVKQLRALASETAGINAPLSQAIDYIG
jgi:hypothetical protein